MRARSSPLPYMISSSLLFLAWRSSETAKEVRYWMRGVSGKVGQKALALSGPVCWAGLSEAQPVIRIRAARVVTSVAGLGGFIRHLRRTVVDSIGLVSYDGRV